MVQLEYDKEQIHADLQSKLRQLSDLASTANELRQQLALTRDQLTNAEKQVSNSSGNGSGSGSGSSSSCCCSCCCIRSAEHC